MKALDAINPRQCFRALRSKTMNDILNDIDWSDSNKVALVISFIAIVLGIFFTEIGVFSVLIGSMIPLLMLLFPWFWVWDVPRRYMFKEAPEEYVTVFAWLGLVSNFIYCVFKSVT